MKNLKIFYLLTLLSASLCFSAYAQLEVGDNGNVGINTEPDTTNSLLIEGRMKIDGGYVGINAEPDSTYRLIIGGRVMIDPGDFGLTIDESGYPTACPSCINWARIYVEDGQNVGSIGSDDDHWEEAFINYIECIDLTETSDIRTKENIRIIENPLQKIVSLEGIMFDYKEELFMPRKGDSIINVDKPYLKNRYGFSAQDVKLIDDNLVRESPSEEYLKLNYIDLIPVLVEAIKEQQLIIEDLSAEIESLKTKEYKKSLASDQDIDSQTPVLMQNTPNPFIGLTSIGYSIPEVNTNASIIIYDMNGKQFRNIPITTGCESSIVISAGGIKPGTYMYSMIIDNQVINSKQMIISEQLLKLI